MSRRESATGRGDPGAERVQEDIGRGHVAQANGHGSSPRARPLLGSAELLYIDDDPASLALMDLFIRDRPGITVRCVMRGRLGIELAEELQPDLILLDLRLPDLSGERVLEALQSNAPTASIPVIVISADARRAVRERVLAAGASVYMIKPIDLGGLISTIDSVLGR